MVSKKQKGITQPKGNAVPAEEAAVMVKPATVLAQHAALGTLEGVTRGAIARVKSMDPAKGASLSNEASTVVLTIDADALRGQTIVNSARAGHEGVHGTAEEKVARWAAMQREVDRVHRKHPSWSWEQVKRHAAGNLACSPKTIQRHCINPKKKS